MDIMVQGKLSLSSHFMKECTKGELDGGGGHVDDVNITRGI